MTQESETQIKVCSKCKTPKPATLEFYYRDRTSLSGLQSRCKVCVLAKDETSTDNATSTPSGVISFEEYCGGPDAFASMPKWKQEAERDNYQTLVRLGKLTRKELTPEERQQVQKQKEERRYREAVAEAQRLASIEHERVFGPPGLPGYESTRQWTAIRNAALQAAKDSIKPSTETSH